MNEIEKRILEVADYPVAEYPALAEQMRMWCETKPLAGLTVLDATPIFRNTTLKYLALLAAGAKLQVGYSSVMPFDPAILELLAACHIPIVTAAQPPQPIDILLDCAGAFAHWLPRLGVSELTRSGAQHYEQANLPVFFADGGRIKRIETCLGTGESCFRALAQLGHTNWQGKRIVIFGAGKVGSGLRYQAEKLGAQVTVITETSPREHVEAAVTTADLLLTATGVKGAVTQVCRPEVVLNSPALRANLGVEDEYGAAIPANAVLNEKRPLNFILPEPTLLRYIDATMALHNAGAVELTKGTVPVGLNPPPPTLEDAILATTRWDGLITADLSAFL